MQKYTGQKLWYHKHLVEILEFIVKICDANDIKYWLYAGTLLGAVRHGGMIPWDFDIDIGIFHEDSEKLIEILKEMNIEQDATTENDFSIMVDRSANGVRVIRLFYSSNTKAVVEKHKNVLSKNQWSSQWGKYYDLFPIHVDVMPWQVKGDKIFSVCIPSKGRPLSEVIKLDYIMFEGRYYTCPRPPESGLIRFFGKDYMTPRTFWDNVEYAQMYDPDNDDIFNEMRKYLSSEELNRLGQLK